MACKSYYVTNNGSGANRTVTFTDCYTGDTVVLTIPLQSGAINPPSFFGVQRYYFSSATTPVTQSGMTALVEVGDVAPPNGFDTASVDYTKHHSTFYRKVLNPAPGTNTTGGFDYVSYFDTLTNEFTGTIRWDYHLGNTFFGNGEMTMIHAVSGSIIEPGAAGITLFDTYGASLSIFTSPIYSGSPVDVQRAVCISVDNQAGAQSPTCNSGTTASYLDCNFSIVTQSWARAADIDINTLSRATVIGGCAFEDGGWVVNSWGSVVTGSSLPPPLPPVPPTPCSTSLFQFSGTDITYNYSIGQKDIVTNIYDSGGYQIQPNSLTASFNSVEFDFTFPTQGWVVVQAADYSQSFSSTVSVNVSHSLNTEDVIVNVFDTNDTLIIPDLVTISGSNNVIVDFAFTSSGYITVVDSIVSQSFTSVTQSIVSHSLATKNLLVAVYDTNNEQIVPDNIQLLNDNTASITFTTLTSGKVVIDRVCRTDNAIFIGTASISQSDDVCLPITVGNDFNNILTWQGTINFDPNVVTFATASNNNIGITLFNPIPGNLTFSWISPYLTGSNFTSGSTLLELCFSGSNSGSTSVQFTGSPTLLEMSDTASNILPINYYTGSIEVAALPLPPSTSVYIGTASVSQSNGVCVPITVGDGFENVLTWQGTIAYNEFVLDYVNTTNNNIGITLFNPTSGSLTFSWISPYITGSTFSSGSTLFEVCFTASEGGFSQLEFTSSPTLLEMSDNSGSIFVVDYYTGSIFVTPLTSSNVDITLYLYATSSQAEYFDILYGNDVNGPWIIAPSGSSVDLLNRYSYTVSIPSGSTWLKLVNKNPEYFPDNFRIHDITFGEPPKGTIPTGSPVVPNLIQSMSGEITIFNDGPSSIEVTNLYMSASIYQQNAFMPVSVNIATGSSYTFIVDSLPTTGSPITFPDQIELVVEISGSVVSQLTGSWVDGGSNTNIYPNAYWSGSLFSSPYTYTYTYFDTKPTFTSQSQARIIGTLTL